jgi:ADP-L-glycero-D-manno-heptose 6-epimerase
MRIVTGGAGFIGSNLIQALNGRGHTDILVVDRPGSTGVEQNFRNLCDLRFSDLMHPDEFLDAIRRNSLPTNIEAVFHQGACADTTCTDGRFMMENNVSFSKAALHFAVERKIPFVYASSAAIYGASLHFRESHENERPLNLYGLSKLAFDNYVREILPSAASTIVGFRYFNVYGPREAHKGRMASMIYQLHGQIRKHGRAQLFEASGGFAAGEQQRDFVSVDDVVRVNLFFATPPVRKGIFNVGTGAARTFNDVARVLIRHLSKENGKDASKAAKTEIEYVKFPEGLREKYQSYTQADITALRANGYADSFASIEEGIAKALPAWSAEQTQ